ncbi:MAG: glycosyltransferase [Candidatus Lokiarchaeota archaeon]|nr:glycosyltransferase [Candidatus Lokiarchaeota archaeon]
MLNLLIFTPLAFENGRGGEISAMELAVGLDRYYNITLLDTNIVIGDEILTKNLIKNKLKGLKRIGRIKFAVLRFFDKVFTFPYPWEIVRLYKIIKKNDIIYTSALTIKTNLLLIFFKLLHRKGKFIIGHRKPLYSGRVFSLYNLKYRISILVFSLFKKRLYHHTISNHARDFLKTFFPSDKVKHITHGVDLINFSQGKAVKKQTEVLKFIYVGYLDDVHKGIGVLLDAIEEVLQNNQDYKILFEFCGTGPLKPKIEELQTKFPTFVIYHGYISNNLIHEYYQNCDVFLLTSRREPFGRVLVEAMAAGLLIVSSKTIGSIEILKGKDFGFFIQKLTPKGISDKIIEVYDLWCNQKSKFRELQQESRDYAFQFYSVDVEVQMFKNLIENLQDN